MEPIRPVYRENWWHMEDKPLREAVRFWYWQQYMNDPTSRMLREVYCMHDIIFFKLLNEWNRTKPGIWQFWSECT